MGLKMGWIAQSVFPPAGAPEVDFLEWLVESMNAAVAARNLGQPQVVPWRAAGAPPQGGGLWSQDWGNWGQNQNWEVGSNQTWQEAQQQEVEEMSWQAWNDLERLDEHMGSIVFLG